MFTFLHNVHVLLQFFPMLPSILSGKFILMYFFGVSVLNVKCVRNISFSFLHSYVYFWICFSIRCLIHLHILQFSSVQSLSRVRLFTTPWIAARQDSLSITNSWSSPKLMSIKSVMPSSHLILCHPLLLLPPIPPSIRVFSNGSTFSMRCQSIGVSALASVLPKNIFRPT